MTKRTLVLSILAAGLLAVTAFGTSVAAKPSDHPGSDHPAARPAISEHQANRSSAQQRHEEMRDAHDAWQDCKRSNETLNQSMQARCMGEKSFFLNATHAHREARALIGAIAALERRIGHLEVREHELSDQLAAGNLTANETAVLQHKVDKINEQQDRMIDRLHHLQARLEALHAKWQSVRDVVAERRHSGEDPLAEDSDSESESGSASSSSSAAA